MKFYSFLKIIFFLLFLSIISSNFLIWIGCEKCVLIANVLIGLFCTCINDITWEGPDRYGLIKICFIRNRYLFLFIKKEESFWTFDGIEKSIELLEDGKRTGEKYDLFGFGRFFIWFSPKV